MNRPAAIQSIPDRTFFESESSAPFINGQSLSVVFKESIVAFILTLLHGASPTAIYRRVAGIVVFAVKSMARRWPQSHIREEVLEGMTPAITNSNASSSVVRVTPVVLIGAALDHHLPHSEFRRTSLAVSRHGLFLQTSARVRHTSTQRVTKHRNLRSAVADAMPSRLSVWLAFVSAHCGKSPESLLSQINKRWHGGIIHNYVSVGERLL